MAKQQPKAPRIATLAAAAVLVLAAVACNTIEGVGKDVKATGSAIEKAASGAKPR